MISVQSAPAPLVISVQSVPATIVISVQSIPATIVISVQGAPATIVISVQSVPATIIISVQSVPATIVISVHSVPATIVISVQSAPATIVISVQSAPATIVISVQGGYCNNRYQCAGSSWNVCLRGLHCLQWQCLITEKQLAPALLVRRVHQSRVLAAPLLHPAAPVAAVQSAPTKTMIRVQGALTIVCMLQFIQGNQFLQ